MAASNLQKVGRLMVKDGVYKDKDGNEKTRYHEIGIVFATPRHSNMCVKFHATAYGDGHFASIFYDDNAKPNFTDKTPSNGKAMDTIIPPEEIPF